MAFLFLFRRKVMQNVFNIANIVAKRFVKYKKCFHND